MQRQAASGEQPWTHSVCSFSTSQVGYIGQRPTMQVKYIVLLEKLVRRRGGLVSPVQSNQQLDAAQSLTVIVYYISKRILEAIG